MVGTVKAPRRFRVEVNARYCKGCDICVQVCPKEVLSISDRGKAAVTNISACTGCLSCEVYCPDFAIQVGEVPADAC